MSLNQNAIRVLNRLAIGLFVVAVVIYVWPLGSGLPGETRAGLSTTVAPPAPRNDTSDARSVVSANILSASRRAPSQRYVSPEVAVQPAFVMPAAFAPTTSNIAGDSMSSPGSTDAGDEVPALYGIVSMNGTSRALLRLSSADASPSLFGEGDKRGNYRVMSIRGNSVVLATPSGTRTLRLARSARGDSSGIMP